MHLVVGWEGVDGCGGLCEGVVRVEVREVVMVGWVEVL